MIMLSVHTTGGRAEIYVECNNIKSIDIAFFTGMDDKKTVEGIIDDIYRSIFLSSIAKKNIYRTLPSALLHIGRPDLAQVAMTDKIVTRLLTGV